jgi:hypothetical protein
MEIRQALKEQYHGGLAMFAHCIHLCPDELWTASNVCGDLDRPFWKIAFHNAFFTHLYMGQNLDAFKPPPSSSAIGGREDLKKLWGPPWEFEPFEIDAKVPACTQADMMEYVDYIDGIVNSTIDGLDLDTEDNGIYWYKNMSKLSHELMNLRHLQGHVGQLSELLMLRGIDINWAGKAENYRRFLE